MSTAASHRVLFLTGVTGFVGAALALELLRRNPGDRVVCLVRADSDARARQRVLDALTAAAAAYDVPAADLASSLARASAVRGDLTAASLGLAPGDRARLRAAGPLHVWHCAASLKDSEEAFAEILAHNVAGTERVLATLLDLGVAEFNHVSTAYVAGRRRGVVPEVLERPRGFSNRYEQSKHYGEMLVVDWCNRAGVPFRVHRPGIVVGHSVTGRATGYTGFLGWVLKVAALDAATDGALRRRSLRYVARPDAELNVVPIDSVVEDMAGIDAAGPATYGRAFHLTNASAPTVRWILDAVTDTLGLQRIDIVSDEGHLDAIGHRFHRWTRFERPYVTGTKVFDRASNALYQSERHGVCPLSNDIMATMVTAAVADYQRQLADKRGAA